jgi:hypothetical protein
VKTLPLNNHRIRRERTGDGSSGLCHWCTAAGNCVRTNFLFKTNRSCCGIHFFRDAYRLRKRPVCFHNYAANETTNYNGVCFFHQRHINKARQPCQLYSDPLDDAGGSVRGIFPLHWSLRGETHLAERAVRALDRQRSRRMPFRGLSSRKFLPSMVSENSKRSIFGSRRSSNAGRHTPAGRNRKG